MSCGLLAVGSGLGQGGDKTRHLAGRRNTRDLHQLVHQRGGRKALVAEHGNALWVPAVRRARVALQSPGESPGSVDLWALVYWGPALEQLE
eukprot:8414537-Pyramimonas_sp.AAC.1